MGILRFTARAQRDIQHALDFTLERFGTDQRAAYAELIDSAVQALAATPELGKQRADIGDGVWAYYLGLPGRRARHLFVYRIAEGGQVVQVLALLYDGMDLPNWRKPRPT